jgi:hypothetical protein
MTTEELSPAELVEVTGKKRPASQAAELAKRGIAFVFTGKGVRVRREVAMAYELMPAPAHTGPDFSRIR